jgi:hypothetical protein
MFSGVTVVTNARVYYSTRAAADAPSVRYSPRPLYPGPKDFQNLGRIALREGEDVSRKETSGFVRSASAEKSCEACRCNNLSSSFSLTGYLPIYSSARLPRLSMYPRKSQRILACIAAATPINSLAT